MGRGGRGGGGGGSRGGGSRSSSRGGGARPSRVSRSSSSMSGRSYRGGYRAPHRSTRTNVYINTERYGMSGYRRTVRTKLTTTISLFITVSLVVVFLLLGMGAVNRPIKNYTPREKLVTDNGFMTDCVQDNSDLFNNDIKMETRLKEFWEKTGVQPIIMSFYYDEDVNSNNDAFDWAVNYYNENIDREDALLMVYFDARDYNDEGYSAVVTGHQADSVMDSEAIEVFWNYFDRYWYNDSLEFDDVFVKTYLSTADTIMTVHKTGTDILFIVIAVVAVAIICGTIIVIVIQKRKQAKEKAESDERILNTDLSKSEVEDHTLNKYL